MSSRSVKGMYKEHPNLKQYSIEGILGRGSYGKVKLASHILTEEKVAIKIIEKAKLMNKNDTERIQIEMKIIAELNHPNIIREIEKFEDESCFYIVMEKPSKGDLFKYICSKKRLSVKEASFMFYQIVNAVDYLHKHQVVHRDLKPENILLSEDMIIKLGDFGLSRNYSDVVRLKTKCGSPAYSSPEMLRGKKYDPILVDIWGLGIILYIMICGQLPFEEENEALLFTKISHCDINYPYFCNASCKALIKRILCPDPQERMPLEEIKQSNIYITGKANFLKEFRVYNDDGSVLPQVSSYIKEKTLKALEFCNIEKTKDIEKTPAFQIFYYKLLHKTDWQNYNIPIHSLKDRAITSSSPKEKERGVRGSSVNKQSNPKKPIKNLLLIRNHSTLSETISSKYQFNNDKSTARPINLKLPALTHSFDSELSTKHIAQANIPSNAPKTGRQYSCRSSSSKMLKNKSKKHSSKEKSNNTGICTKHKVLPLKVGNKIVPYSIEDYEKDLNYLKKRGYKQSSLTKIKPSIKV